MRKTILAIAVLLFATLSNAALLERFGGLAYYDDETDLTWLADANYAVSNTFGVSGINQDGTMSWFTANSWIDAMNANSHLGSNQWRLPETTPVSGSIFNLAPSLDGSTDQGYNIGVPGSAYPNHTGSDMPYLYYITLGNLGAYPPPSFTRSGCADNAPNYCLVNSGPFNNLQPWIYWTGSEQTDGSDPHIAFNFQFVNGAQNFELKTSDTLYAWAVMDGDISAVPIPAAIWLFGSGLIGLFTSARCRS